MTSILQRHIALMLVIMCVVCTIESTRDRTPNNRRRDRPVVSTTNNLCEKGVDMKLLCHCNHDHYKQKINEVDCFLLHEEFPQSDPSWFAFNSHPNIKHIQLTVTQHGFLGYLPIDVFRRQRDLQTLNIQYGNIREIPSYAFSNLTRVHNITLEHNQVEVLNAFAFANHAALAELNLQLNQITSINRLAFVNLPKLEELMLSHNNISTLPNDVFANITNLNKLRLNDNLLTALTRDVFKGLGKLMQLDLSVNNLKSLGDGVFAELWSLQELYLENNSLERISERAFDGLNNLRILHLQNNKIALLENGVFSTVPAVTTLNLNNNLLEWLTYTTVLPIMDNLVNNTSSVLSISENRFICECRLRWIFDLHNQTKNRELKQSLERITCMLEHAHQVVNDNALNDPRYQIHFETNPRNAQPMDFDVHNDLSVPTNHINERHSSSKLHSSEKVELLNLNPNQLPCEAVTDPTELPLQRESVSGYDIGGFKLFASSGSSHGIATNFIVTAILAISTAIILS